MRKNKYPNDERIALLIALPRLYKLWHLGIKVDNRAEKLFDIVERMFIGLTVYKNVDSSEDLKDPNWDIYVNSNKEVFFGIIDMSNVKVISFSSDYVEFLSGVLKYEFGTINGHKYPFWENIKKLLMNCAKRNGIVFEETTIAMNKEMVADFERLIVL